MTSIVGAVVKKIQELSQGSLESDQVTAPKDTKTFEATLSSFIKASSKSEVNEEELFAALIGQRLEALKGSDVKAAYQKAFEAQKIACRRPDGKECIETAARAALGDVQAQKLISKDEANSVHSSAFAAAQLDDNKNALYDSIGGAGDPTKAVEKMEKAMLLVKAMVEKIDAGALNVKDKPLNADYGNAAGTSKAKVLKDTTTSGSVITPSGSVVDGPDGFLFKPISTNEGRLAVLLPAQYTGQIEQILLKDKKDKELESGRFTSNGDGEGGRTKYSFSRPGGDYPKDLTVELSLKNGKKISWKIGDPSLRYD